MFLFRTYLSPSFTGGQGSFLSGQESGILHLSNSECMENKAVTDLLNLLVSKDAIQAFRSFSESPEAQARLTVVASIVSDPSVWNAVQQNHAFVEFFESHKTSDSLLDMDKSTTETVDAADPSSPRLFDESCDTAKQSYGNWIRKILGNFRVSVVEMMSSFPGFFPNHEAKAEAEAETDGTSKAETDGTSKAEADGAFKAYLMGLVIMVIMLVVFKRV
ncbi:hypothetical protein RJ640_004585 [Escallonia rubra]|uniref:Uncharacterized protein n=1 Tax=Escallonia rubra TaxID=112253 RepID=A0AA88S945_9ASTE|nr:hypothetical protein RJ640_004585 [Escallonia rubra]